MLKNNTLQSVYLTEEIRHIETLAADSNLMEKAGLAAAEIARDEFGRYGKSVLILAGPGNNGGDAFVVARHLKSWWFNVVVLFYGDSASLPTNAAQAYKKWQGAFGKTINALPKDFHCDWIIDGLFGIGLQREPSDNYLDLIKQINQTQKPVLSLDVPSGINANTGAIFGDAIRANVTITFIGLKPGLLTLDGPDYCGDIYVKDLDIPPEKSKGCVVHAEHFQSILRPRKLNSHKGTHAAVGIVGGSVGMIGAAILAARAALKTGAGKVYVGISPGLDIMQPEIMFRSANETLNLDINSLVVGPGSGESSEAADWIQKALTIDVPLVLDADALNLISKNKKLQAALRQRKNFTVLTPHPAEAGRLLNQTTETVQKNRLQAAFNLAKDFNSVVILKGVGSICAFPDQHWFINTTGNPGMASAGMGDVLSGILGTLIAQHTDFEKAVLLALYLHGAAADEQVKNKIGPIGLTASEIIDTARDLLNQWTYQP